MGCNPRRQGAHDARYRCASKACDDGPAALVALQAARQAGTPIPLVLLDAHMPGMDGWAVAAQITQDLSLVGATIMMLSSGGQRGDAARCRAMGIAAYLMKPVTHAELWDAILEVLGTTAPAPDRTLVTRHTMQEAHRRLRILVAEDNAVNQRLARRLLEKQGHSVAVVDNGRAALATLAQQPFDLVLMDVQMPDMDGLETTAAIRAQEQETGGHLPIIALTAHTMQGDHRRTVYGHRLAAQPRAGPTPALEDVMPRKHCAYQRLHAPPAGAPIGRVRRDQAVDEGGHVQRAYHPKDQGEMGSRTDPMHGKRHHATPLDSFTDGFIRVEARAMAEPFAPRSKIPSSRQNPLNMGRRIGERGRAS